MAPEVLEWRPRNYSSHLMKNKYVSMRRQQQIIENSSMPSSSSSALNYSSIRLSFKMYDDPLEYQNRRTYKSMIVPRIGGGITLS